MPVSSLARSAGHLEPGEASTVPAVAVTNLSFDYGKRRALDQLSFAISRGEIFGLLGPNGGGKTTLFKLLSTLVPIQTGDAQVMGYDLKRDTAALRRSIGVVFQHPGVDGKLTVAENLTHQGHLYGMHGTPLRTRRAEMLEQLGLGARANDLLETLSGGLKRRVELAKALLHGPQLLILDEPTTGLDPSARREFLSYVCDLRDHAGVTAVLTTHQIDEAERCDRIGLLHQGRLVALAPPAELKAQVGGDVVVISAGDVEGLRQKILAQMRVKGTVVDGTLRVERPRGHEFVRDVVEAFGSDIESITFGKPTLEDVFVRLTGQRFYSGGAEEPR